MLIVTMTWEKYNLTNHVFTEINIVNYTIDHAIPLIIRCLVFIMTYPTAPITVPKIIKFVSYTKKQKIEKPVESEDVKTIDVAPIAWSCSRCYTLITVILTIALAVILWSLSRIPIICRILIKNAVNMWKLMNMSSHRNPSHLLKQNRNKAFSP